jgi:hypothetical protein
MNSAPPPPLPGPRRKRRRSPEREGFEIVIAEGGLVRVEGWIPDRRYSQDLRVTLPDKRVLGVEGFRYGWFVWREDDESNLAAGELTGCIAAVLGWWDETWPDEWPEWVWALEEKLGARDHGRDQPSPSGS